MNSTHRFLRELSRRGVTGAIDAGATGFPDCYAALRTLRAQNRLPVRTALNVFAAHPGSERDELAAMVDGLNLGGDDMLWFNGVGEALTLDGVDFSNFAQPRPELSDALGRHLEPVVRLLVERRWPFSFHATYDESISRFLGRAGEGGPRRPLRRPALGRGARRDDPAGDASTGWRHSAAGSRCSTGWPTAASSS